jgi:hypothetical protein
MEHAIDLFTGKMIYLPSYHVFQRLLDIHFLLGGSQNNERETKTAAGLPDIDNKLFSVLAATQTQKIDGSTYLLTCLPSRLSNYISFSSRLGRRFGKQTFCDVQSFFFNNSIRKMIEFHSDNATDKQKQVFDVMGTSKMRSNFFLLFIYS